jgi:putative two-component system response regulator
LANLTRTDPVRNPLPAADRLAQLGRNELAEALAPAAATLRGTLSQADADLAIDAALATGRSLYSLGRSGEAIALAQAALYQARQWPGSPRIYRALGACGILSADAFDVVSAIEYHAQVLKLATLESQPLELARAWGNIGLALNLAGSPHMAARAHARSIEAIEHLEGPQFSRYIGYTNRASTLFHLGLYEDGLRAGLQAVEELTPEFAAQDRHCVILLHRNLVHLLVATGRVAEAGERVTQLAALAAQADSPRAFIAAATARAAYELAVGQNDVALTRLDQALARARATPSCLRDALVCLIRAEEMVGSPERALARLHELSEHVHKSGIEGARRSLESHALGTSPVDGDVSTRARLISRLGRPEAPEGWDALRRMAVSAALRADPSGWHGMRVGALTQTLARAGGETPLRALEIGLAAELHDIGLLSVPEEVIAKAHERPSDDFLKHTSAGAEILREDRHSRAMLASEVSAYHHAWWDGSGHPCNVGGPFIPSAARMCAVADAYDELVCGFGGSSGMSMGRALHALKGMAGSRLDPDLVRHFDAAVRDESSNRGIDPDRDAGMEGFQELVTALHQDRGYL